MRAIQRIARELRVPSQFRESIGKLLRGDLAAVPPEERRERVKQVVRLSAAAAMLLSALPVPFLNLPVHAAMVRAIARMHGMEDSERKVLWRLAAALGIGLSIRTGLRFIPFAGQLSRLASAYGTAWALGQAANLYFEQAARERTSFDRPAARRRFIDTLRRMVGEQSEWLESSAALERLRVLKSDWDAGRIGDAAFRAQVEALLARP